MIGRTRSQGGWSITASSNCATPCRSRRASPPQKPEPVASKPADESTKRDAENRRSKVDIRNDLRAATPELAARLARYTDELGLAFEDADILTGDLGLARFFEAALTVHDNAQSVANWVTNEVLREAKDQPLDALPFGGEQVGKLAALVDGGEITPAIAKEVFAEMMRSGDDPAAIVEKRGLSPITDPAKLRPVVEAVIAANPDKAEQVRGGKTGLAGFFVGQVMRETRNRATPKLVQELVAADVIGGIARNSLSTHSRSGNRPSAFHRTRFLRLRIRRLGNRRYNTPLIFYVYVGLS